MPDPRKDIYSIPRTHDPIEVDLAPADDRLLLNHWLPPQRASSPYPHRPALDQRLVGATDRAVALMFMIALAQSLRELPGVHAFIKDTVEFRRPRPRSIPAFRDGCGAALPNMLS